jgi:formylglycine-generating enzyme required for sulfatase activity
VSDIFLSYASPDRPRVKPLVDALRQQGWSVWWDRTILPGKTWDQVIEAALDDARCVIVLWSRASIQSHWVRTEADEAMRRRILVPALLDDVIIPLAFRRIQAANLVDWSGVLPSAGFDELARAVSEVLSNAAPLAIAATAPSANAESATTVVALEAQNRDRANAAKKAEEERVVTQAKAEQRAEAERVAARRVEGQRVAREQAEAAKGTESGAQTRGHRTLLLIIGGLTLASVAVLSWYFATHRHVLPSPETKLVPGTVRENPKDGLAYVWIPPGRFNMGCSQGDSECSDDEKPSHPVSISKGFWMGQTEVTQDAYQRVMGQNPSHFNGAQRPVEQVTWNQASDYCGKVALRLPTEAEWEYAARAGTGGARYGDLDKVAWYTSKSKSSVETKPVRGLQPNLWGLYDMLGNVWEWVADWYGGNYEAGETTDPVGAQSGTGRIVRGGAWFYLPQCVRVSYRFRYEPTFRYDSIGFRCAGELR